jgi:hypothetical protein
LLKYKKTNGDKMTWIISRAMMKAYENSPCSQGLVEEYWEENYSDGERFAPLNVIVTPHPFWLRDKTTDILSHSRFSQMSASLTESLGEDVLMWCREASRAKTSPQPEKEQESEESEVDLWGEMARIIGEVRPRYIWVENSPLLVSRGLGLVLLDLAEMGYELRMGSCGSAPRRSQTQAGSVLDQGRVGRLRPLTRTRQEHRTARCSGC